MHWWQAYALSTAAFIVCVTVIVAIVLAAGFIVEHVPQDWWPGIGLGVLALFFVHLGAAAFMESEREI